MKANTLPREMATNELTGPSTTVRGRWLLIVRLLWLAITLLTVTVHITNKAFLLKSLTEGWAGSADFWFALLNRAILVVPVAYYLVAAVIAWRKFNDWLALFVSAMLMTFGAIVLFVGAEPWDSDRALSLVRAVGLGCFLVLFLIFPDGRFVPRWTRWLALAWVTFTLSWLIVPSLEPAWSSDASVPPIVAMLAGSLGIGAATQIYRYVRVSNRVQRQQTKWVLLGFMAASFAFGSAFAILWFGPQLTSDALLRDKLWLVFLLLVLLSLICVPVSIGIAVLRFRLWDIDPLINRALVYTSLTLSLGLVYVGSVFLLERIMSGFTGQMQEQPIMVVASTLLIAAIFQPLRRRIQATIDRRFYRRKYDAARTLQAFSATLRDEVDLNRLTEDLLTVVEETMQPAHVSVWIRHTPATRAAGWVADSRLPPAVQPRD